MKLTKLQIETLYTGTVDDRKFVCEFSFAAFVLYYFSEFFSYKIAGYQEDFYEDCQRLANAKLKEVAWIAFRESGKTTIAKMFVVWCIVYSFKKYINVDSSTKDASVTFLFDVITMLQTNERLLTDWGHFYTEKQKGDEKQLKRIEAFITANKIKVEAFSTGIPFRGRVYMNYRPDLVITDDLENSETARSGAVTQQIISHINEMRAGLSPAAGVLYLGNYITDIGVMRYIRDAVTRSSDGMIRDIPVERSGRVVWPDKYVLTDSEASEQNSRLPKERWKVSLESKRRELGETVYAQEMLNDPIRAGDMVFDRRTIDELLKNVREAREINAGFHIWEPFNPSHRYGIGSDTSEGGGLDSNTSVLIDFSKMPCEQVGSYANNTISPDVFAYELKREGELYGKPIVGVEINSTGLTTISSLRNIYPIEKIYRRQEMDKAAGKITKKLGWRTTSQTKPEMIYQLKTAIEEGRLIIRDERILKEMREYGISDLSEGDKTTRHFDLLVATAIAWQMNQYALLINSDTKYETQPSMNDPKYYREDVFENKRFDDGTFADFNPEFQRR